MDIAIAAPNDLAAEAGAQVAAMGGNAVDVAVAAAVMSMVTEPGICSLAGGAYLVVDWPGGGEVVDANVAMPGAGAPRRPPGSGTFDIHTGYGGGVDMTIGHGSVAVPGAPAGLALVHGRHGRVPWRDVWGPAIAAARDGFPLGAASTYYLQYVHENLYGWHPPSHAALHHADGRLLATGERVVVDHLADTLAAMAEDPATLYTGELARLVVADVAANDGLLTHEDLARYRPVVREPLTTALAGHAGVWTVATNPPPAVGGVTLTAMLDLVLRAGPLARTWDHEMVARIATVQDLVLSRRILDLDPARDREVAGRALLAAVARGDFDAALASPSTIHVSTVDGDGLGCAITSSAGYGSGVMPPGTGLWLNNCLGEQELNPNGLHGWEVGARLPSNMAPTIATGPAGQRLVVGSPGADRITTAILQVLVRFMGGAGLTEAIAAPRLHVRHRPDGALLRIAHEEDLHVGPLAHPTEPHHANAMFFGGVAAALRHADGSLEAAADPRRAGAALVA